MNITMLHRFLKDIKYNFILPPRGIDFGNMNKKEAAETFMWFMDHLPEKMDYLRFRCSSDLHISIKKLDYSDKSLVLIWRWFLKVARLEDTPREILDTMIEGSKIFGDSYISRKVLSVTTHMIVIDIALYTGECYIRNYPHLCWTYRTAPRDSITINQPVISGMISTYKGKNRPIDFAPIHMVGVQASGILDNSANEEDLINMYQCWEKYAVKS